MMTMLRVLQVELTLTLPLTQPLTLTLTLALTLTLTRQGEAVPEGAQHAQGGALA